MDRWAASFHEKSERRRRRNSGSAAIRIALTAILLTAAIGTAFWVVLTILEELDSF